MSSIAHPWFQRRLGHRHQLRAERCQRALCVGVLHHRQGTGITGGGILIRPTGTGNANVVLNQIHVENNAQGVKVDSTGGTSAVNLNFVDSVSAGNTNFNVGAFTTAGQGNPNVMLNRASLSASILGLRSDGPTSTVRSATPWSSATSPASSAPMAACCSPMGNNQITGNTTDGTTTPVALDEGQSRRFAGCMHPAKQSSHSRPILSDHAGWRMPTSSRCFSRSAGSW